MSVARPVSMKDARNVARTSARGVRRRVPNATRPSVIGVTITHVSTVGLQCVVPARVSTTVY